MAQRGFATCWHLHERLHSKVLVLGLVVHAASGANHDEVEEVVEGEVESYY